eukprot:gene843-139_t
MVCIAGPATQRFDKIFGKAQAAAYITKGSPETSQNGRSSEQYIVYADLAKTNNGHKRVHSITFQCTNGLCINLSGPVEERRHDSRMLADSGLLGMLQRLLLQPDGGQLCIYGDPAYPHRPQLQAPFKAAMLTQEEKDWKKSMSQIRIQVEWMFGDNINYSIS